MLATNFFGALALLAFMAGEPGTIRFTTADQVLEFAPDGVKQRERAIARHDPLDKQLSPDGKQRLYAEDGAVYLAEKDGQHERRITPEALRCAAPIWSPTGDEIAFSALVNDQWQLHTVGVDGKHLRQLTEGPAGIERPRYSPGGRLSYLRMKVHEGKFQPADLMLIDTKEPTALVENVFISDYAWSPDGKTLAIGKLHELMFLDVATGKAQVVSLATVSDQLFHHAPTSIAWSPDSQAIVCRLPAHVGRAATLAGEPAKKIFGDDEIFVIPRDGAARWFVLGDVYGKLEWVK